MFVYRIVLKPYGQSLFATGTEGRWNSAGRKVLYAADSIPLAFMENMVRRKGLGFDDHFCTMIIEIPDQFKIEKVDISKLNSQWRHPQNYSFSQVIGNKWYDSGKTVALKVPSAVFPDTNSFVLNTTHSEFQKVKLIKTIPFLPDERIEDILKNYRK